VIDIDWNAVTVTLLKALSNPADEKHIFTITSKESKVLEELILGIDASDLNHDDSTLAQMLKTPEDSIYLLNLIKHSPADVRESVITALYRSKKSLDTLAIYIGKDCVKPLKWTYSILKGSNNFISAIESKPPPGETPLSQIKNSILAT
jgi:hypothetical protein